MDTSQDVDFKKSYAKYKLIIKQWEKEFIKSKGRIPSKHDFKEADSEVRRAYNRYFNLKYEMLEGVAGDALKPSPRKDCCGPVSPSLSPRLSSPISPPLLSRNLPSLDQIERLVAVAKPESNDRVWGSHLNNAEKNRKENEKIVKKTKTPDLSKVSQKLFKSCSFNKRNPRKLISFKSKDASEGAPRPPDSIDDTPAGLDVSRWETLDKNLIIANSEETQPVPVDVFQISSVFSAVRNVDQKWVERCSEIPSEDSREIQRPNSPASLRFAPTPEEPIKPSYGIRNLNLNPNFEKTVPFDSSLSDCIGNSESENEENQKKKKYEKIKPIVKKRKLDDKVLSETKVKENILKSNKSSDSATDIWNSSDDKPILNEKKITKPRKKATKNVKGKKPPRLNEPERREEELNGLTDHDVEMPRYIINRSKLKDNNIVDGLASALELPKKQKNKKTNNRNLSKAEEKLQSKIDSGSLNDNFVRINIEKKVFVRGKNSINYSKFKKKQWKDKKKALNALGPEFPEGGVLKCFKCDQVGHFARYCKAHKGNELLPLRETTEESFHKTLNEVENLSKPIAENSLADDKFLFQSIEEPVEFSADNEPIEKSTIKPDLVPETFLKLLAAIPEKPPETLNTILVEPIYPLGTDGELMSTTAEVKEALDLFGHLNFRNGQEQAIMRILSGMSTLLTLSTGSGKSLCYQLPAYIYSKHYKCVTLVISPLVSLMEDQVSNMPSFLHAGCLHTNQSPKQREKIMELIRNGDINILLISPEAVVSSERSNGFGGILKQLPPIAFVCIDEVHCVSQWSHNFRPSYLMICRVLREKLGVKCILGLTATATTVTVKSVMEHIGISDGLKGVISNTPIPDNLILTVSKDKQRDKAILELLVSERFCKCESIIIYCIRRDECERIAGLIRTSLPNYRQISTETDKTASRKRKRFDWLVESYHAGMSGAKRKRVQQAFMSGDLKIVVATIAFGMGINKSDIRAVIHYNMPKSFESYVQEVGRAGRDGLIAHCHAFIDFDGKDKYELLRHIHSDSIERHVIRKLLQKIFVPCACKIVKTSGVESDEIPKARKCQGHEVAFSVDDTVRELDIPSENICTLLCYLELHANKYIKILSNVYMMCKIMSYGGATTIIETAQKCPPLAMAIALEKNKGKSFENVGNFEFCVIDVAAAIGWQSGLVKYHLKNLEWDKTGDKIKRSLLQVEFHTLGFRVMAPGDLEPYELDAALDSVYERTQLQEKTMLHQLQHISQTLSHVSYKSIIDCSESAEDSSYFEKSTILKNSIQEYFGKEGQPELLPIEKRPFNEDHVVSDVRGLISSYRDCVFTGRAVARIFQGINSPNFPAIVWGKCRYWRSHIMSDFYKLSEVAKQQIMLMR